MSHLLLFAVIFTVVAAATGLLQLLLWAVAVAIQLMVWALWAVLCGASLIWVAIFDRPALARMWREAGETARRRRSPFALTAQTATPSRWNL